MPTLSACNIIRIYSKVEDYKIENKTHVNTEYEWERKWWQSQIHFVTKSHGYSRQERGLLTSSAAVLPLKIMPCTMFQSIQTFSVNGKFTEHDHFLCAQIDLLLTIFVCLCYRLWATIRLLHHFGFVMCVNSRLYNVCIFRAINAKYVMFCIGWCKSLKDSATPNNCKA